MRFDFDKYKGKYVMLCETYDEALDFCEVLYDAGRTWFSGDSYLHRTNYSHEHGTYYYFNEGKYDPVKIKPEPRYTVLKWRDFMKGTFGKKDLKTGMLVENREGNRFIVFAREDDSLIFVKEHGWYLVGSLNEDLTAKEGVTDSLDIMIVWNRPMVYTYNLDLTGTYRQILFERKEELEVTMDEIAKMFGVSVDTLKVKK